MKTTYQFTITYECEVDTSTGEILETRIVNKSKMAAPKIIKAAKKKDDGAKLILSANKYSLTDEAIGLLGIAPDDKLDIRYETENNISYPIIVVDNNTGNRLTKSGTVAFRGVKNETLAKYGTEFEVVKHPVEQGVFILKSDKIVEVPKGDDNVNLDDSLDFNLDKLVDNATEIDSSLFKL